MKKMITISMVCIWCLFVNAQQTDITVHINAGELKDSLTAEQMKTVRNLTITGSMNQEDFSVIKGNLRALEKLDIENVVVDSISEEALNFASGRYGYLYEFRLPANIQFIGKNAINAYKIVVTGNFPILDEAAFSTRNYIIVSENNRKCKMIDNNIYSADGKLFYYFNDNGNFSRSIAEGTETIVSRSFDNRSIRELFFPSTLKQIEEKVFNNSDCLIPAGEKDDGYPPLCLHFKSELPPTLGREVFTFEDPYQRWNYFSIYFIHVPKDCRDIYKAADMQWSVFKGIIEEREPIPPDNISLNSSSSLQFFKENSYWKISDESTISRIEIINIMGLLVYLEVCNEKTIYIPCNRISGINCLRIYYKDNKTKVIKIIS